MLVGSVYHACVLGSYFHHCVPAGTVEGSVTVRVTVSPGVKHTMLKLKSPCGNVAAGRGLVGSGTAVKPTIQPTSEVNEAMPVPVAVATDFVGA